ncbi:hypothetical protein ACHQM5_004333 [Ranunculus cassubicifolius]
MIDCLLHDSFPKEFDIHCVLAVMIVQVYSLMLHEEENMKIIVIIATYTYLILPILVNQTRNFRACYSNNSWRYHDEVAHQNHHAHGFGEDAENMVKKVKQALADGEGCRVYGVLDVQRVAGNFHISVHGLNIFVAQQIFEGATHVNVSHMINDLSFGPKYPGIHNPLDGTNRILRGPSGTFKYYIKIVPTEYKYISKDVLPTNQFSVTEYFVPMTEFDRTWPAVYFLYDLSPITVTIKEERRSFLHLITRLCAILGGTFALTGMLDRWMFRLMELLTKSPTRRAL